MRAVKSTERVRLDDVVIALITRAVESEVPSSDSWKFRLSNSDSDLQLY